MAVTEAPFRPGLKLPASMYVDSNVIIAFLDANHPHNLAAIRFIGDAVSSRCRICISTLVLDEVWYKLMVTWHDAEHGAKFQHDSPGQVKLYSDRIEQKTRELFKLLRPVVLAFPREFFRLRKWVRPRETLGRYLELSLSLLKGANFGPRNTFHLANSLHARVEGFATMDRTFSKLVGYHAKIVVVTIA